MTGRFDLVTLDLDGTLIPHDTVFAAILRDNGFEAEAKETDEAYFAGTMSLEECFRRQWALIQPLELAALHRSLRKAAWLPGIAQGVAKLKASGLEVSLLTDQPSTCTDFLGRWGLINAISSPVKVKEGKQVSIDMRFDKLANLRKSATERGISLQRICHVGNGSNDVPVFGAVGGSVAVWGDPTVEAAAQRNIATPATLNEVVDVVLALHGKMESSKKSP